MNPTCLIAAHDPWFIQLLEAYVVECGYRVVQAFECQEVIPLSQQERPSLILIRLDLPGCLNVGELLHLIKQDHLLARIPILAFYTQLTPEQAKQVELASALLQEPVSYEIFLDTLKKLKLEIKTIAI
jgi:CheY-like chemotaxis protein